MHPFAIVLAACAIAMASTDARAADPKAATGDNVATQTRPDPCAIPKRDAKKPADRKVTAPAGAADSTKPR